MLLRTRLLSIALLIPAPLLFAQATPTGDRGVGLSAYGGMLFEDSKYVGNENKGFLLGAEAMESRRLLNPALDVRFTESSGNVVSDHTFTAALKAEKNVFHLKPYVEGGAGIGSITFKHPVPNPNGSVYAQDNSVVYLFGGGVDLPATRLFDVKVDLEDQVWHLGTVAGYRYPLQISAGVVYHLPFRSLPGRR